MSHVALAPRCPWCGEALNVQGSSGYMVALYAHYDDSLACASAAEARRNEPPLGECDPIPWRRRSLPLRDLLREVFG